ncbi:tryptophan-rich sensory protein [Pseudonocardia acidicola]|uniref:TspO/MBR related protein n=1 Tax=Pseudonocardia acidicola TaxID=2724939 RepID=A0ABX1S833_9PSEU|nr:tryptophan-rich sensory protein [Pseudonocardia acidicola]NMH96747.1 hypothetical protein [Pseudonocardia acidicola]
MTVVAPRSTAFDLLRAVLVAVLAVVQIVVSGLAGSGAVGEPIAVVANSHRTPLLAAGWTFSVWTLIYLGFGAYAVFQLLPAQRGRAVHRRTGWWLAATAVFNPLWILAFGSRHLLLAELLIVALLVSLACVFGRLSHEPVASVVERAVFRVPIAIYTGWVSLAVVIGTAATGAWIGLPGGGALAAAAAVAVLLAAAAIVSSVVGTGTSVVGYAAAAVWALVGIALNGPPAAVAVAAWLAVVVVVATTTRRVARSVQPARLAWG